MTANANGSDEKFLLIDCDPGTDDCLAIMMALSNSSNKNVKVVGITTVNGNVDVNKVTMNAARIVKLCNMTDEVPIYRGCEHPIIISPSSFNASHFHGEDGLGDVPELEPRSDVTLLDLIQKEHAVNAILQFSREYAGKLQILALGPLTNIALATRIDPNLPSRIKSLHVLGGTIRGCGNITPAAEYNFYIDPEAADITLGSFSPQCPTQLLPYEVTIDHVLSKDWFDKLLDSEDKKKRFFNRIYGFCARNGRKSDDGYVICDSYLMATVLDPTCVTKSKKIKMCVELSGRISRASLVIDHRSKGSPYLYKGDIELIEGIDMEKFKHQVTKAFLL